ncbi:MAG: hypothetical protein IKW76_06185, partial [Clostridia bacterium]|nr:hypothetical protein [Clostridia bacterium]
MTFEDLLEQIENAVDSGTNVAFTNKTMVDTKAIKTCLEDMRLNLPVEIAQARNVLAERNSIIEKAKADSANIVQSAQDKVKDFVTKSEDKARELVRQADEFSKKTTAEAE